MQKEIVVGYHIGIPDVLWGVLFNDLTPHHHYRNSRVLITDFLNLLSDFFMPIYWLMSFCVVEEIQKGK